MIRALLALAVLPFLLSACDQAPSGPSSQPTGQPTGGQPRAAPPHLVEVAEVSPRALSHSVVRTGTLIAQRSVRIFNQEEGQVATVTVREGDRVEAGQPLILLDQRLLRSELAKAEAARVLAESNFARTRELSARNVASREKLIQDETNLRVAEAEVALIKTRLDYSEIKAPFAGVATARLIEPGDVAPRNTHLLTLIDPDTLYTRIEVSELMLPRLSVGNPVALRIDALGDKVFEGHIQRIHPTLDQRTRLGIVEVALDPVPPGAAVGQLCRVTLSAPEAPRLSMPFAALRHDGQGAYVFALDGDKAVLRRVATGLRIGDLVEVLDGLSGGDKVVTRGFLDLTSGKTVSVVATPAPS